jgi:hypothetical protein
MNIVNQKDIKQLIKIDKIFAIIADKYGHPPNWTRPQGFISLSKIILEQQVSLASAIAPSGRTHPANRDSVESVEPGYRGWQIHISG